MLQLSTMLATSTGSNRTMEGNGNLPGAGWANLDFYAGGIPGVSFAMRYSRSYNGLNVIQRERLRAL
jgi:hypothetical protein